MKRYKSILKIKLLLILIMPYLNASETGILDNLTLTNISFNVDENGNINPYIFIPIYYGSSNQFYSSIGFGSKNTKEVSAITNFANSKNAFISSSKELTINYVTYKTVLFGYAVSFGVESSLRKIKNNEFGYIQDSNNFFTKGSEYYISFDNEVDLDIQSHALRADIVVPFGTQFSSRFFASVSPFAKIGVKQSTMFKPLVSETGASSSSTMQDIGYRFRYDGLIKTGYSFDIGLVAYYDNQPLKYNVAQLSQNGNSYTFKTNLVNTTEITTQYIIKILLSKKMLGGLRPSIGYGIENIDTISNITKSTSSTKRNIFTFAFEKLF